MSGLCSSVSGFGFLFLLIAALAAIAETQLTLLAKRKALKAAPETKKDFVKTEGLAKVLEALAKVLLALKDLPAWVAVFLAGLALVWTATSAPGLCT